MSDEDEIWQLQQAVYDFTDIVAEKEERIAELEVENKRSEAAYWLYKRLYSKESNQGAGIMKCDKCKLDIFRPRYRKGKPPRYYCNKCGRRLR